MCNQCGNINCNCSPCTDCVERETFVIQTKPKDNCGDLADLIKETIIGAGGNVCALSINQIALRQGNVRVYASGALSGDIEYSKGGAVWQSSPIFLAPTEDVDFYARLKENVTCVVGKRYYDYDDCGTACGEWVDTNETRCVVQIREIKQTNACNEIRWIEDPLGWTLTSETRCT